MKRDLKRVFVTGTTGSLGQAIVPELQRRGIEVTGLERKRRTGASHKIIVGKLQDLYKHADEISASDAILHLASSRGNDPYSVYNCDALGTLQLLRMWSRGPFIYPCSQGVYGVPHAPLVETSPISPTYWFDIGHIINEMQLSVESRINNRRPAISLRFAAMIPTGTRRDDQFFSTTLQQCLSNVTFLVDSDEGAATYGTSFLSSGDLAVACVDALSLKDSGPYNVAGGFCTWKELIDLVNRLAGTKARIDVRSDVTPKNSNEVRLPQSRSLIVDSKFRAATGFAHRNTLEQAIKNWMQVTLNAKPKR